MATQGLKKLAKQVEVKVDGDLFHEIVRHRPHHISTMSPTYVQNVDIHEGEWGTVGCIIYWNYTHDGKECVAKERMTAIDEEKKSVTYEVIDGDLLKKYKTFFITIHVDPKGGENNLVTWTYEYEKLNDGVEDPNSLMDFCIAVTKDIETHHLTK